jgi:squalene-associated FAD-dependent desaturase
MTARVTVVGAGLAGLSATVWLVEAGVPVRLVDSAAQAGGRCRSYHDPQLGLTIDNGNHLVLSGNAAVARYRATIGATGALSGPDEAAFAFMDLPSGERWTVRVNDSPLPWWLLSRGRRVPGTRARDYLPLARLMGRGDARIDARVTPAGRAWERFVAPVLLAALNTDPAEGSSSLAGAVLRETVARGGRAMRPLIAEPTLAAAFVEPALRWLEARGATLTLGRRLRGVGFEGDVVTSLDFGLSAEPVEGPIVLALPAWIASELVPGLTVPDEHRAIVNAHFAVVPPAGAPRTLGLTGATAEWLFAFPDRISVTVSAADRLVDVDRAELAAIFWGEIQRAYGFKAEMPRWQIVKEKRATFAATPAQNARRPKARTCWRNLILAGDWTQTGLPATIEGALRSGETAARLARTVTAG